MKKLLCIILVIVMTALCFSACTFNSNISGVSSSMQSKEQVESMMAELAEGDVDEALELMHPTVVQSEAEDACAQMSTYLAGREVTNMELVGINVNVSTGMTGKVRQEKATYKVELDDGTVIHLASTYSSDKDGEGFISFQLVLGIV